VVLLKLDRSRILQGWWIALHAVLLLTSWGCFGALSLIALPLLAWHFTRCDPVRSRLILMTDESVVSLPVEGRMCLKPVPKSAVGPGWIRLVLPDQPRHPVLILRDQTDETGWRLLSLAAGESG
jgi:hypothetical protein